MERRQPLLFKNNTDFKKLFGIEKSTPNDTIHRVENTPIYSGTFHCRAKKRYTIKMPIFADVETQEIIWTIQD
ncbi:MAG: hypothetical protein LBT46_04495 [Planctomycetaceae bacterium]|jgi:hypothetical protein|nr:hypothetical protein [Planctomycetaceae bacterium]